MQNKVRENCSLKYYIYLIARSRAYNYINLERRRSELNDKYSLFESEKIENDVSDFIIKKEKEKELIKAINMLNDKYKNAIYLIKIEELSYKETSEILRRNNWKHKSTCT